MTNKEAERVARTGREVEKKEYTEESEKVEVGDEEQEDRQKTTRRD